MYGYTKNDVSLPDLGPIKESCRITTKVTRKHRRRHLGLRSPFIGIAKADLQVLPVACSIGPVDPQFVPPSPCRTDVLSAEYGFLKRMGQHLGDIPESFLRGLRQHVRDYISTHYRPISSADLLQFDKWIDSTHYSMRRKLELTQIAHSTGLDSRELAGTIDFKRMRRVNCFVKPEFYTEYKAHRIISSRSDYAKCVYGPIAKAIEQVVYGGDHTNFIKHVPVRERPGFLKRRIPAECAALESDFSSFECHFNRPLMDACEFELYRYMLQDIANYHGLDFRKRDDVEKFLEPLCSSNDMRLLGESYSLDATRMSGEVFTSLGNGFTNLMVSTYLLKTSGIHVLDAFVEGDDGLFIIDPRDADLIPSADILKDLGLRIKYVYHAAPTHAGFCGLRYNTRTEHILRDPFPVLYSIGWAMGKPFIQSEAEALGLFKAKLLSLAYECPGCPILTTFALEALARLKHVHANFTAQERDWYKASQLRFYRNMDEAGITVGCDQDDRDLFAALYGVDVDKQLQIEDDFRNAPTVFEMLHSPTLQVIMASPVYDSWHDYANKRVHYARKGSAIESLDVAGLQDIYCHTDRTAYLFRAGDHRSLELEGRSRSIQPVLEKIPVIKPCLSSTQMMSIDDDYGVMARHFSVILDNMLDLDRVDFSHLDNRGFETAASQAS